MINHGTFTIKRVLRASPERVFAAWSSAARMRAWFHGPVEWGPGEFEIDFRVGGGGRSSTGPAGRPPHRFVSRYYEIIENARIVYAYEMYSGDQRMSISLATIELEAVAEGTRLVLNEQGAYLDESWGGNDSRMQGTRMLMDQLAEAVQG